MDSKFVFVDVIKIPDQSSPDGVSPSTWGIFDGKPDVKTFRYRCKFCNVIIEARFPRWDRMLGKTHDETAPLNGWKSPCCIKNVERIE